MFSAIWGFQDIRELYAEQTTAIETIAAIVVTVAVCLLFACLVYIGLMSLDWALRMRPKVKFHRVFLPSREQFAEYAGDYVLAFATSLVLTLTMAAKHQTVEHITAQLEQMELNEPGDCERYDVAHVFPVHACPEELAGVSVVNLLKLADEHGRSDQVEFVLKQLYRKEESTGDLPGFWISESGLIAFCIVLILCYLAWLARRRSTMLLSDPEGGTGPEYSQTVRPLLALAFCVALLLAAPQILPSAETVARSTLAAIEEREPVPTEDTVAIESVFEQQQTSLSMLEGVDSSSGEDSILAIINSVRGDVRRLEIEHSAQRQQMAGDLAALRLRHDEDMQRIADLQNRERDLLATTQTQLAEITNQVRSMQTDVAGARTDASSAQAQAERANAAVADLSRRMDAALRQNESGVAALEQRVEQAERAVAGAQSVHNRLQGGLTGTNQTLAAQRKTIGGISNQLGQLEQQLDSLGTISAQRALAARLAKLEKDVTACCRPVVK